MDSESSESTAVDVTGAGRGRVADRQE